MSGSATCKGAWAEHEEADAVRIRAQEQTDQTWLFKRYAESNMLVEAS